VQRRPEAWGLIVPFLASGDPYVQFFGAHTAQVKVARDWFVFSSDYFIVVVGLICCRETFPRDDALQLRDLILELTCDAISARRDKFIIRKLFVAVNFICYDIDRNA
jgi:hypothetical protein